MLLYGAGDAGALALREIRQNSDLEFEPIGFVDDDPTKQGRMVDGLPVVGGGQRLVQICREHGVETVILAIANLSEERLREIRRTCRNGGIFLRKLGVNLETESEAMDREKVLGNS